jgi:hypothetical protein
MATIVALGAACGGQTADTPAEEAPAPEEPAPAPEVAPAPEPEPMPEVPQEPAVPQLTGNIVEMDLGEEQMVWTTAATREVPGRYYWLVRLRNDTTQTLDITVSFDFLDEQDAVVKTDRKTERLQPAEEKLYRVEGEMNRDQSRAVVGYSYVWDWEIVEGN